MGYTTDFDGEFIVSPPLKPTHRAYLEAFSSTRRMERNAKLTAKLPDPLRKAVGLPIGTDGGYFVGDTDGEGFDCRGQTLRALSDVSQPPIPGIDQTVD